MTRSSAFRIAWTASAPSGRYVEHVNDDRCRVNDAHTLALVADARGPTYGGYYAPFAVDPGIEELFRTFERASGTGRERMQVALRAANATMGAMHARYEAARAGRLGLTAALEAADAVRPAAWMSWRGRSHAHFTASITACATVEDELVIAQVGGCRAYARRNGRIEQLVADHSLASVMQEKGASAEDVLRARTEHAGVVVAFLGMEELHVNIVSIEHDDAIVLCSDGVHTDESRVSALLDARSESEVRHVVMEAVSDPNADDATAVVLRR